MINKLLIFSGCFLFLWSCSNNVEVDYKFYKQPEEDKAFFRLGSSSFNSYNDYTLISYGLFNSYVTRVKNDESHNRPLAYGLICLDSNSNILWSKNFLFRSENYFLEPILIFNNKIYAARMEREALIYQEAVSIDINSGNVQSLSAAEKDYYFQELDSMSLTKAYNYLSAYEDSLTVHTFTPLFDNKTKIAVYNNGQKIWSDSFNFREGASYFNPDIAEPLLFVMAYGKLICFDVQTGRKIWSLDSLNPGISSVMNYDRETSLLYFKHGYIYAIDYKTGEVKYEIDKVYLDRVEGVSSHKIFNERYLFIRDSHAIDVYDKHTGDLIQTINLPQKDSHYNTTFEDLMVKNDNLIIITSNPFSIVSMPIKQLLQVKEMEFKGDSIVFK